MSTPVPAVSVQNVSKCYSIAHQERATTLAEAMVTRLKNPLHKPTREEFWALHDVSFDVAPGEVVGIIGRNGAGKSTLLKILSRIAWPTTGQIDLRGRVGSLLEVGTGFHPELTGRENIFLNGAILGMRHREIEKHFDEIVEFAGVEQFLDTPVKRYSSGMYVRLAFAVAAHLNSDILIIDEVLAVGDAEFQKKCLNKMQDIASAEHRTILFVSHNMASIQSLCERCIVLQKGSVAFDGPSEEAAELYLQLLQDEVKAAGTAQDGQAPLAPGEFDLSFHENPYQQRRYIQKVSLSNSAGAPASEIGMGEDLNIAVDIMHDADEMNLELSVFIRTKEGQLLSRIGSYNAPDSTRKTAAQQERFTLHLPALPLAPGAYVLDFLLRSRQGAAITKMDRATNLVRFTVYPQDIMPSGHEFNVNDGPLYLHADWERLPLNATRFS
jgi:lipopolysaccharide transport system ATP-binding protein